MKTPDEIRTELSDARKKVLTVIEATPEGNWKKLPFNGPDEWNIQQVVEHIIDVEIILTTRVCKSCGYPGPESPFSDKGPQCPTRESAIEAFNMAVEVSNSKIKYVTETDLAIERPGETHATVGAVMERWIGHIHEHLDQIAAFEPINE